MHIVDKPFRCKLNQFRQGEQDLCIGVHVSALQSKPVHTVKVGNKVYDIDAQKALNLAMEKNSFFKNGSVAIVPFLLVSKENI